MNSVGKIWIIEYILSQPGICWKEILNNEHVVRIKGKRFIAICESEGSWDAPEPEGLKFEEHIDEVHEKSAKSMRIMFRHRTKIGDSKSLYYSLFWTKFYFR